MERARYLYPQAMTLRNYGCKKKTQVIYMTWTVSRGKCNRLNIRAWAKKLKARQVLQKSLENWLTLFGYQCQNLSQLYKVVFFIYNTIQVLLSAGHLFHGSWHMSRNSLLNFDITAPWSARKDSGQCIPTVRLALYLCRHGGKPSTPPTCRGDRRYSTRATLRLQYHRCKESKPRAKMASARRLRAGSHTPLGCASILRILSSPAPCLLMPKPHLCPEDDSQERKPRLTRLSTSKPASCVMGRCGAGVGGGLGSGFGGMRRKAYACMLYDFLLSLARRWMRTR